MSAIARHQFRAAVARWGETAAAAEEAISLARGIVAQRGGSARLQDLAADVIIAEVLRS